MPARARLPLRLILAWCLVAAAMLACLPAGSVLSIVQWYYLAAVALYSASKIAMLLLLSPEERSRLSGVRLMAYWFWWGMKIEPFLRGGQPGRTPPWPLWLTGIINLAVAAILLWGVPRLLPQDTPLTLRLVIGLAGYALLFLFGLGDLWAALFWAGGIPVEKLFDNPVAAASLADFWSHRWNRIFSDFARTLFFWPLAPRLGVVSASLVVFLFAGALHEWAWSFPSRGGYGGPMAYFLIQWLGLTIEGNRRGRRLLRGTTLGHIWTWVVVLAPSPLLLHEYMLHRVVLDTLRPMGVPGLPGP
jgi:alginate O-acetyltransferase complex protein AlgI